MMLKSRGLIARSGHLGVTVEKDGHFGVLREMT